MTWYRDPEAAEAWLKNWQNIETTRAIIEWFDAVPEAWEWLAHEAQARAQRGEVIRVRNLLRDLWWRSDLPMLEVGMPIPYPWVPWIGMLLVHEQPTVADYIVLPKPGHNGWKRKSL